MDIGLLRVLKTGNPAKETVVDWWTKIYTALQCEIHCTAQVLKAAQAGSGAEKKATGNFTRYSLYTTAVLLSSVQNSVQVYSVQLYTVHMWSVQ